MESEKTIGQKGNNPQEVRSLNTTFKVMLCIFFWYLFRISIGGISQIRKSIIPDILQSDSPIFFSIFYIVWVLWIVLGFVAIILALKGARSAITCLKLCLPFHFISLFINGMTRISDFSFGSLLLPILFLFFPLIFFIYLCSSKEIKQEYPREERNLGFPGILGVILYSILGLLLIQMIVSSVKKGYEGKKVALDRIELHEDELTDGRVIFKPGETWQLDSIVTPLSIEDAFCFHDTLDNAIIRVSCTTEEYEPSRHYYIYSITENQPFDTRQYKNEIGHKQFETDDAVFFIDQYKYQVDSVDYYWTYASRLGKKVEKGIRLSVVNKDSLRTSIEEAIEFLRNTDFSVRDRLLKKD